MSKRKAEQILEPDSKQQKSLLNFFSPLFPRELWGIVLHYVPKQEYPLIRLTNKWSSQFIQVKKFSGVLPVYYVDKKHHWIASLSDFAEHYAEHYDDDKLWEYLLTYVQFGNSEISTISNSYCIKSLENLKLLADNPNTRDKVSVYDCFIYGLAQHGLKLPKSKILKKHWHTPQSLGFLDVVASCAFKSGNIECIKYYLDKLLKLGYYIDQRTFLLAIESGSLEAVVHIYGRMRFLKSYLINTLTFCRALAAFTNNIKMAKLVTYMCVNIEHELTSAKFFAGWSDKKMVESLIENYPYLRKVNISQDEIDFVEVPIATEEKYKTITLDNYEEIIAMLPDHAFDIERWDKCVLNAEQNLIIPGLHNAQLLIELTWSKFEKRVKPLSMEMTRFFFERPRMGNIVTALPNPDDIPYDVSKRGRLLLNYGQINVFKFCYEVGYIQEKPFLLENGLSRLLHVNRMDIIQMMTKLTKKLIKSTLSSASFFAITGVESVKWLYEIDPEMAVRIYREADWTWYISHFFVSFSSCTHLLFFAVARFNGIQKNS